MERNEISLHELRVFNFVKQSGKWVTSKEIAEQAKVAPRTARAHASKLVQLGIFDVAEVFPAHRYKIAEKASKRNQAYILRLEQALNVFEGEI